MLVEPVFDLIFVSALELSGDGCPARPILLVKLRDLLVFVLCPGSLFDFRVMFDLPAFTTLLSIFLGQKMSNLDPVAFSVNLNLIF